MVQTIRGYGSAVAAACQYAYDPATLGLAQTTDPTGNITSAKYDVAGNRLTAKDGLGRTTTWTYNALHEPLTVQDPLGVTTTSAYGDAGYATGGVPAQHTLTYANFTDFGQPKTVTDQVGHAWTFLFEVNQNRTDVTDADGRRTHTVFNEENQPTLVTRPGAVTQGASYDDNENMVTQTDGLTHVTTYGYDAQARPVSGRTRCPEWRPRRLTGREPGQGGSAWYPEWVVDHHVWLPRREPEDEHHL